MIDYNPCEFRSFRNYPNDDKNSKKDWSLPINRKNPHINNAKKINGARTVTTKINTAIMPPRMEPPTKNEVAVLEGGTFVTIVTLLWSSEILEGNFFITFTLLWSSEKSEGNFFIIFTLLRSRGRLCDSELIGTQLLPSSLICKPIAAAWAIIDCRSWIEFFEGILDEIWTPSNICLYNIT